MLRRTNKELGHSSGYVIPRYYYMFSWPLYNPPLHAAKQPRAHFSTSKIWKDTEASGILPIGALRSLSSQRRLQDCGEPQMRGTRSGRSAADDSGDCLGVETPHMRGRLSPSGPTRGPIETRSGLRKTLRSQPLKSCLMSRLHRTCGRRATNSKSSQREILCSTSIKVQRRALPQPRMICMAPHFKRSDAG